MSPQQPAAYGAEPRMRASGTAGRPTPTRSGGITRLRGVSVALTGSHRANGSEPSTGKRKQRTRELEGS
jgi:hypothetical protein